MPSYTDEGVILRTVKLGEADRIITILTKNHGKIRAVARGVRRTKSRFGGRLEVFNRDKFLIFEGRGELQHINQAESIDAYGAHFITDYDAYIAANVMVESVDKLLDSASDLVGSDVREYYFLLIAALNSLARGQHSAHIIENSFLLRMLAIGGWYPRLDACVVCGRQTELDYFSVQAGGMMCRTDRILEASSIDTATRTQLYALLHGNWKLLTGSGGTEVSLGPETTEIVEEWLQYYVERPVRSLKLVGLHV